jgi:hypothetical protein
VPLWLDVMPLETNSLRWWLGLKLQQGYSIVHYIRHPATIAALRQLGVPIDEQPNACPYQYADGDVMVVVTLRRPQRGQEVHEVQPEDLDIRVVRVST